MERFLDISYMVLKTLGCDTYTPMAYELLLSILANCDANNIFAVLFHLHGGTKTGRLSRDQAMQSIAFIDSVTQEDMAAALDAKNEEGTAPADNLDLAGYQRLMLRVLNGKIILW